MLLTLCSLANMCPLGMLSIKNLSTKSPSTTYVLLLLTPRAQIIGNSNSVTNSGLSMAITPKGSLRLLIKIWPQYVLVNIFPLWVN